MVQFTLNMNYVGLQNLIIHQKRKQFCGTEEVNNMANEKVNEHLRRMEALRKGEKIDCPFCGKGQISKKNDAVFLCDSCGKGIVGRVNVIQ